MEKQFKQRIYSMIMAVYLEWKNMAQWCCKISLRDQVEGIKFQNDRQKKKMSLLEHR